MRIWNLHSIQKSILSTLLICLASCMPPPSEEVEILRLSRDLGRPATTFDKFLNRAGSDDARAQNLVGFMLYFGEGVDQDREQAYFWFDMAARNGDELGARNLVFIKALRSGQPLESLLPRFSVELSETVNRNRLQTVNIADNAIRKAGQVKNNTSLSSRLKRGATNYAQFCSGCHGLNGVATYVRSPSFALAERLEKSDLQLGHAIRHGIGIMPGWEGKLSNQALDDILAYIRTMPAQYEIGIAQSLRSAPQRFFLFGPAAQSNSGQGR